MGLIKRSLCVFALVLGGCVGKPEGVEPVQDFSLQSYTGTWYEIARLDHSFEEGLERVTAEYTSRPDGGVDVLNRGFNVDTGEWESAEGKAYFVEDKSTAHLKVSFFGPFYNSYIVFELGDNYEYAFVTGPDKEYLWLLARKPEVSPELYQRFTQQAGKLGYDTSALIRVDHEGVALKSD